MTSSYTMYVSKTCRWCLRLTGRGPGEDSPTQQGRSICRFWRLVPGIKWRAARRRRSAAMLHWALTQPACAIRYARSKAPTIGDKDDATYAAARCWRGHGRHAAGVGPVVGTCLAVADALQKEGYSVSVADARWIKPTMAHCCTDCIHADYYGRGEYASRWFWLGCFEYFADHGGLDDVKIRRLGFDRFRSCHPRGTTGGDG